MKQIAAYGHTPGHTVYQTGNILIVGDIMHGTALQLPHPEICAEYDGWAEMPADKNGQVMETMDIYGNRLHLFSENDSLPVQKQGS